MTFSAPFEPVAQDDAGAKGKYPILRHAFEAAVTTADAYHAVRQALRAQRGILRLGNRFVREDQYGDIGFVALGNAAGSMALALMHGLGERVTRGFVAGPEDPPPEVPFRFRTVLPPAFGSPEAEEVSSAVLELVQESGPRDLLIVLLSAGALGLLAPGPEGMGGAAWSAWIAQLLRAGATGAEIGLLVRLVGGGAAGGRLAQAAGSATVETLVVDHGDGGAAVGGGPTILPSAEERKQARQVVERLGLVSNLSARDRALLAPDPAVGTQFGPHVHRPVVVAQPAEALRGAAAAIAERKWVSRILAERLPDPMTAGAGEFLDRVNVAAQQSEKVPATGVARGLVLLAGTTLGLAEGIDEREAFDEFLRLTATQTRRREVVIGIARTAGAVADRRGAAGKLIFTQDAASGNAPLHAMNLPMRAGITDVGCLAVALVPFRGTA